MPFYLESLDGSQSYLASMFSRKSDLDDGRIYDLDELDFTDWLKTAGGQHKAPQKKLRARWYGPNKPASKGGDQ